MEQEFDNYVKNYNLNNNQIKSKYDHSYRVMKLRADITGDIETPDVLEAKHVKKIESKDN